jgi:hypothetical protein
MIDIGKKLLFTVCKIFENVQFFSHLHLKYGKSFFLKNINMGIKKTQNFMLLSNSLMPALKNALNKS